MLFEELVTTSAAVGSTSSRLAKSQALADLLVRLAPDEVEPTIGFLVGEPRQGRIGIGWKTIQAAQAATDRSPEASLEVLEVDAAITALGGLSGPGSGTARIELLGDVFGRATADEASFLSRLLGGELRQGANAGVMLDAVAKASGIPATVVRRAVMLGGRLDTTARLALTEGRAAVEAVGLEVGRALQPMLASTAASVTEAVEAIGEASVEWKLDGIRIQVHKSGDEVRIFTRNLNDITERLGEVVAVVRGLPADSLVLDGEALVVDATGRPVAFQDTASRVGADAERTEAVLPHFFDLVHVDGRDLVDEPLSVRAAELERVAGDWRIPGTVTADPDAGEAVLVDALAAGHEGVVVKGVGSAYEAGRRGKAWRKVKPVHTLDLVVLAVEWGYGRRTGWLSNLHLGARADDGSGFVMVGKTFKGMTDELLRWQTQRFQELAVREEPWTGPQTGTVWVRPEQVVEIALDGAQRSTTYPGGVALRFARVLRYREDKDAADADLLSAVQALVAGTPVADPEA
ncbi:ATP-dependent DNA ligase [Aquihabitans sp. G128]|uniref:ATP-dependent DNA ligase n=1 Tax=Aquihabitans sp. G128 TaxID=2849779 RepID=UPI001C231035|nr:ATP-dependent DNA ligase [Aquihabitans sp. G128]QXC61167.1 ATP-dependent DNA ligase [Aquihabitans sp. G128]